MRLGKLRLFLFIFLLFTQAACSVFYNPYQSDATTLKVDSLSIPTEDSASIAIIAPFKNSLDAEMNEIIGYSEQYLFKETPEGLLNNLIADIVLTETNGFFASKESKIITDIALLNNGGLRAPLPSGALTTRHIFELMPFNNELVVLELTGQKTKEMFDFIAYAKGLPLGGAVMGIKDVEAVNIKVNGKPFDIHKNYFVVTSDYLANGGDKMSFFSEPVSKTVTGYLVRDAIIHYIKEETKNKRPIDSKLDKRIYFE